MKSKTTTMTITRKNPTTLCPSNVEVEMLCCKQIIVNDFYVNVFPAFVGIDVPILTELILP